MDIHRASLLSYLIGIDQLCKKKRNILEILPVNSLATIAQVLNDEDTTVTLVIEDDVEYNVILQHVSDINDTRINIIHLKDFRIFSDYDLIIINNLDFLLSLFDDNGQNRLQILANIIQSLADDGLLMVDYRVAPGFDRFNSLLNLLKFHVSNISDKENAGKHTRDFLHFLATTEYSKEAIELNKTIASISDKELLLSYMNHQYANRFQDLIAFIDGLGYTFLTDDSTASFFNDHLKDEYKSFLAQSNNLIAVEQYLDYFTNRDKRNSLFCKSAQITGQKQPLEIDRLFDVEICSKIKVDSAIDKLMTDEPQVFSIDEDLSITVDTRIMKIALKILSDVYPKYITFNNLYKSCLDYFRYKMVSVQEANEELKNSFIMQLLKLSFGLGAGIIKLSHYKRDKRVLNAIKAMVGISSLNYTLFKSDKVMLDIDGKRISFDDVGYAIYRHLTESTAVTDLIKKVIDMLNSGEIAMSIVNQHSDSDESIESIANRITLEYLNKLLNLGILLDCKC